MSNTSSDYASLTLSGSLNIRSAPETHQSIMAALSGAKGLVVDLGAASDVDLSFVQLLQAARLYAKAHAKEVALAKPAAGPLLEVLRRGGFLETASNEDAKFWLHKESVQ